MKYCILFLLIHTLKCESRYDWQTELTAKIDRNQPAPWMIEQVKKDLSLFQTGITQEMLDPQNTQDLARIRIKDRKVYAQPLNLKVPFQKPKLEEIKRVLIDLCTIANIPDVEFLMSFHDGYTAESLPTSAPIFSFSKDADANSSIILIPDYFICSKEKQGFHKDLLLYNTLSPWTEKKEKAFWRGSSTGIYKPTMLETITYSCSLNLLRTIPRFKLVELSQHYPEIVDARFTRINSACSKNEEVIFAFKPHLFSHSVSIKDHIQYKYQILIDGTTSAWERAYWQLWSNCLILKQESKNIQWFYGGLEAYEHYVPFNNDCSNLISIIEWAKNNDEEAQRIAQNATAFARENLTYASILYYYYYLLTQYAKLQTSNPELTIEIMNH